MTAAEGWVWEALRVASRRRNAEAGRALQAGLLGAARAVLSEQVVALEGGCGGRNQVKGKSGPLGDVEQ
jgi:hypothetical protein